MAANQKSPVLRMDCQHCGSGKHAIQYRAPRYQRATEKTLVEHPDQPGVCLVCPRCDSPSAAAAR